MFTHVQARSWSARRLLPFLLLPVLLTGCGGGSSSTSSKGVVTSTPRTASGLQFTLSANKSSYAVGEAVQLTLAVKNTSAQPAIIAAPSSGDEIVVQAMQNNQVVWTNPQGGTGPSPLASPSFTIAAGQTLTVSRTWLQTSDMTGQQASIGAYTVQAYLSTPGVDGVAFTSEQAQAALDANPIQIAIHN